MNDLDRFKVQQERIQFFNSKEFKEATKEEREQMERDYWSWYNDQGDRTPEDFQGWDIEDNEEE